MQYNISLYRLPGDVVPERCIHCHLRSTGSLEKVSFLTKGLQFLFKWKYFLSFFLRYINCICPNYSENVHERHNVNRANVNTPVLHRIRCRVQVYISPTSGRGVWKTNPINKIRRALSVAEHWGMVIIPTNLRYCPLRFAGICLHALWKVPMAAQR